jgi:hypothetical protein
MEEGQHFWGEYKGNLYVFVKEDNGFFRAGNWEGEYLKNELKIAGAWDCARVRWV